MSDYIVYVSMSGLGRWHKLRPQKTYLGVISVKVKKSEGNKEQGKKEEGRKDVTQLGRLPV